MAVAAILAGLREQLVYNPAGCCAAMRHIAGLYPHVTSMKLARLFVTPGFRLLKAFIYPIKILFLFTWPVIFGCNKKESNPTPNILIALADDVSLGVPADAARDEQ